MPDIDAKELTQPSPQTSNKPEAARVIQSGFECLPARNGGYVLRNNLRNMPGVIEFPLAAFSCPIDMIDYLIDAFGVSKSELIDQWKEVK